VVDPQLRDRESQLSADLAVDTHEEIERLSDDFQAAGVAFFQTLRKEPSDAMTFIVWDPDGQPVALCGTGHVRACGPNWAR
jgi:hypothetical protein